MQNFAEFFFSKKCREILTNVFAIVFLKTSLRISPENLTCFILTIVFGFILSCFCSLSFSLSISFSQRFSSTGFLRTHAIDLVFWLIA
jgi:hypothetical protein